MNPEIPSIGDCGCGLTSLRTYGGRINLYEESEGGEYGLAIGGGGLLLEELEWITGKRVTARYWITDFPCTKEEAAYAYLCVLLGKSECTYNAVYSEYTGYLWSEELFKIGGHDLFEELKNNHGKWAILELEVYELKKEIENE